MPKRKICFISGTFPPMRCGIGDYTACLLKALTAETGELEFEIFTSREAQPQTELEVFNIMTSWSWAELPRILKALYQSRPAVVHFQYPTAVYGRKLMITFLPWLVRLLAIITFNWSLKCFVTVHEYASFRRLGKIRIWLMVLACQTIVVVSPETLPALSFLRKLGKRLVFISVGSAISTETPKAYQQSPAEWLNAKEVASDRPVIAYFGFVSPSKGLTDVIKAFAQLQQPAQLLLIADPQAQDSNYQSYFEEVSVLIKENNLAEKIKWTGFAANEEVAAYLQNATVGIFPFTDGISLRRTSALAAMSNGLAIISTFSNGEVPGIAHLENIWLAKSGDVQGLAQGLETLLKDANLREKIAQNGQKLAESLSWSQIAKQHRELYSPRK